VIYPSIVYNSCYIVTIMVRYNFDAGTEEEGSASKYNEAWLKMRRLHDLQSMINIAGLNPTAFNPELGIYNYQVKVNCCNALLLEVWGKLNEEERHNAVTMKEAIEEKMIKNPIHENKKDFSKNKTITVLENKNWNVLKGWIFKYETLIKELLTKTKYDSPDFDYDDGGL